MLQLRNTCPPKVQIAIPRTGPAASPCRNLGPERRSCPPVAVASACPASPWGFLANDQPRHSLALVSDRRVDQPLAANEAWLLPAEAEGYGSFEDQFEMTMVEIDADLLTEMGAKGTAIAPHVGAFDPVLQALLAQAPAFDQGCVLYSQTMQRALVAQLLQGATPPAPATRDIADHRLARVIALIHDAPGAAHSLEMMAAEIALSPYHFARGFKAKTGLPPLQYVIKARVEMAQGLLKTTRLPVAEIAYRCGYEDSSRFTAHFRKRVGRTPAAFRAG